MILMGLFNEDSSPYPMFPTYWNLPQEPEYLCGAPRYCPWCGTKFNTTQKYRYCPWCGKELKIDRYEPAMK